MPDFVQTTIGFIDTNWNTANFDPKPTLIDARDAERDDSSRPRTVKHDLTESNAVSVGHGLGTDFEPVGLGWSHDRVDASFTVRVEAVHAGDEFGHVDDAADFGTLVDEVVRTLKVERKRPIEDYWWLAVQSTDSQSPNWSDYFREDIGVAYVGLDDLP